MLSPEINCAGKIKKVKFSTAKKSILFNPSVVVNLLWTLPRVSAYGLHPRLLLLWPLQGLIKKRIR